MPIPIVQNKEDQDFPRASLDDWDESKANSPEGFGGSSRCQDTGGGVRKMSNRMLRVFL